MAEETVWRTRRASIQDRDALASLCRSAVGPDDYILRVLDDLLLRNVTFVALDDDRIVGSMTYREVFDGSAWLSAARTHPRYRRKGVALALVRALEGVARMKGLHALRLWSSASNRAGVAAFTRAGFREVARFDRIVSDAARSPTRVSLARIALTEDTWSRIEGSPLLARTNGYVAHEWAFVPLDRANAHYLSNRGALWGWGANAVILADASETFGDDVLEMSPVHGDLRAILREAPRIARGRERGRVESFVPHDEGTLRIAADAGFAPGSWGKEAILCERLLDVAKVVRRVRKTYAEINASKRSGYAALALLAPGGHGHTGPHEDRWNR